MEASLIKNRDFIVFGLQPWDYPSGSNCKNIAEEISRFNRVLYVNRPLDRFSRIKHRKDPRTKNRLESIRQGKNQLTKMGSGLWVLNPPVMLESVNFLPRGMVYNYLNKRNARILAREIHLAVEKIGFSAPILIIDNDFLNGLYLPDFLKPQIFVYYIRDYLLSQPYFIRHGQKAEPDLIRKADLVAANSKYLAGYASRYLDASFDIGQGCDTSDFLKTPADLPQDMSGIQKPVIGYCGALIATRLDLDLLYDLARQEPGWNFVLVGPEDEEFRKSSLHDCPNVYFLGAKPVSELPKYIHQFDVCINPQLLNQMTIGNYPRKVDEYLAAGKPVVATQTEAMEMFSSHVYLCSSREEYIDGIRKALNETSGEVNAVARKEFAQSHTWSASVHKLYEAIIKTKKDDQYE